MLSCHGPIQHETSASIHRSTSLMAADTVISGEQGAVRAAATPPNDVTEEEEVEVLSPRSMTMKEEKGEN